MVVNQYGEDQLFIKQKTNLDSALSKNQITQNMYNQTLNKATQEALSRQNTNTFDPVKDETAKIDVPETSTNINTDNPNVDGGGTTTGVNTDNTADKNNNTEEKTETIDYNDPNNEYTFMKQMMGGEPIAGSGLAVNNARERFNKYNNLATLGADQIGNSLVGGTLSPYSKEIIDIKNFNPELYSEIVSSMKDTVKLNSINNIGKNIYEAGTKDAQDGEYVNNDMTTEKIEERSIIKKYDEDLYNKITKTFGEQASGVMSIVSDILQSPKITQQAEKLSELEAKKSELNNQASNLQETIRTKLGSEAPDYLVSSYISQQARYIQRDIDSVSSDIIIEQGKLDNYMQEVETILDVLYDNIDTTKQDTSAPTTKNFGTTKSADRRQRDPVKQDWVKMEGTGGTSGGTGTSTGSGAGSTGIDAIYDDIMNGNFGGSYTSTNLKKYGLSNYTDNMIWYNIGKKLGGSGQGEIKVDEVIDKLSAGMSESQLNSLISAIYSGWDEGSSSWVDQGGTMDEETSTQDKSFLQKAGGVVKSIGTGIKNVRNNIFNK